MRILFFCSEAIGHYLEYIHHMYMYAFHAMPNNEIIFVLPITFREKMRYLNFPIKNNLSILFFTVEELESYTKKNNVINKNLTRILLLKKYIKKIKPDRIFLPDIVNYIPWIMFMPFNYKITGIEYRIPGRRAGKIRLSERINDNLKLLIYAYSPCINNILLLNDKEYSMLYNKRFRTSRFNFLPDPIVPISGNKSDISYIFKEKKNNTKVFLHCGGMGERKGTYTIIDAIKLLTEEERNKCMFVFAGRIDVKKTIEFKRQIEELSQIVSIHFIEGFLEFDVLSELFKYSDYVLVPYKNVSQSSGIIGHAAQYGKVVIGPEEGLLGYLIKEYKLGITIPAITSQKLKNMISFLIQRNTQSIDGKYYLEISNPENFAKIIYNSIIKKEKKN